MNLEANWVKNYLIYLTIVNFVTTCYISAFCFNDPARGSNKFENTGRKSCPVGFPLTILSAKTLNVTYMLEFQLSHWCAHLILLFHVFQLEFSKLEVICLIYYLLEVLWLPPTSPPKKFKVGYQVNHNLLIHQSWNFQNLRFFVYVMTLKRFYCSKVA